MTKKCDPNIHVSLLDSISLALVLDWDYLNVNSLTCDK